MNKLFIVSDVHSFLTPLKEALDEAGFDPNNEEHWLVSCGDLFDRGPESKELLHYIMSLDRKILIRGNHDILLDNCCMREFPYSHDNHNGTVTTIKDLGGWNNNQNFVECCINTWNSLAAYRNTLINYFETKNYIFVHSFVPLTVTYDESASKPWHKTGKQYAFMEDWRNASATDWEEAMWVNPFELAWQGLNKTGKTIVFGHWHCSAGWFLKEGISEFGDDARWTIYHDTDRQIIGIDRCTVHTNKVNVLVIEDDFIN
jgi:hypothetical protein